MSPKQRRIYNIMNKIYTKIELFAKWFDRLIAPKCRFCKGGRIVYEGTIISDSGLAKEVYKCHKCKKQYINIEL